MMTQQPDKIFREKLASYSKPAPANAWARLEGELDKKNSHVLWLKIAASLMLLAIATYLLWPSAQQAGHPPLASNPKDAAVAKGNTPVTGGQIVPAPHGNGIGKENSPAQPLPEPLKRKSTVQQKEPQKNAIASGEKTKPATHRYDAKETVAFAENIAIAELNDTLNNIETTDKPPTTVAHTPKVSGGRTIVLTTADTDQYLDKKALAEATSNDKKSSTFKQLWKKAADLKNNQDPMGDLRQMKNEILALNFKKKNVDKSNNDL